jgi:hypothetical protein
MYDLATLNAAKRHKHSRRHRNRAEGGMFAMTATKASNLVRFGTSKFFEGFVSAGLGAMDGNTGEAVFLQSTDAGGKVDPTSGIGLKALLALGANAAELVRILAGHSFGNKYGLVGDAIDGVFEGTASASWCSWTYLQGLTYGKAKRLAEEKGKGAGAGARVDYRSRELESRRDVPRETHAPQQQAQARSAGVDWYYRTFARQAA